MDRWAEPEFQSALVAAAPFVFGALGLLAVGLSRRRSEAPAWIWGVGLAATWALGFHLAATQLVGAGQAAGAAAAVLDATASQGRLAVATAARAGASGGAALSGIAALVAALVGGRTVERAARTLPLAVCLGMMAAVVGPIAVWLALHGAPAWAYRGPMAAIVAALVAGVLLARRREGSDATGDARALVGALLLPLTAAWAWDSALASAASQVHGAHAALDGKLLPDALNLHRGVRNASGPVAAVTVIAGLLAGALGLATRQPQLRPLPVLAALGSMVLAIVAGTHGRVALGRAHGDALLQSAEHRLQVLAGTVDNLPLPGVRPTLQLTVPVAADLLVSSVDGAPWRRVEEPARGARVERPLPAATRVVVAAAPATPAALLGGAWTDSLTSAGQLQVLAARVPVAALDDAALPDWRVSAVPFDVWPAWSDQANPAFWEALDPSQIALVNDDGGVVTLTLPAGPPAALGPTFDADAALATALAGSGVQAVVLATPLSWTLQDLVNLCLAARGDDPATARRCVLAPSLPLRLGPAPPAEEAAAPSAQPRQRRSKRAATAVSGSLSSADVAPTVASAQALLGVCSAGGARVKLRVGADGRVEETRLISGPADVAACAAGVVRKLRFPSSPDGGRSSVEFSF